MKKILLAVCAILPALASSSWAETSTVCTVAANANSGKVIVRDGDCTRRMSPASTFKIPISLMGFDSQILLSPKEPEWPFKEGYSDTRPEWRTTQTPASWMRYSTIWYSQQITLRLGLTKFTSYVDKFDYGNKDLAGTSGKRNGLTTAWLSSSLQISPDEQVEFLRKLVRHELPVSEGAVEHTRALLDQGEKNGWHIFGKTGSGRFTASNGKRNPFGWFVGWAEHGKTKVVFARLIVDSERQPISAGIRTRDALIPELFAKNGPLNSVQP